jgi:hypothetical protein
VSATYTEKWDSTAPISMRVGHDSIPVFRIYVKSLFQQMIQKSFGYSEMRLAGAMKSGQAAAGDRPPCPLASEGFSDGIVALWDRVISSHRLVEAGIP